MRVAEHGPLHAWKPPDRTCPQCQAKIVDITKRDLEVYTYMDGDQREEWKVEDICIKCPDCSSRVTFSGVRKPAGLLDEIKKLQGIQKPLPKLQAWNQDYNR